MIGTPCRHGSPSSSSHPEPARRPSSKITGISDPFFIASTLTGRRKTIRTRIPEGIRPHIQPSTLTDAGPPSEATASIAWVIMLGFQREHAIARLRSCLPGPSPASCGCGLQQPQSRASATAVAHDLLDRRRTGDSGIGVFDPLAQEASLQQSPFKRVEPHGEVAAAHFQDLVLRAGGNRRGRLVAANSSALLLICPSARPCAGSASGDESDE